MDPSKSNKLLLVLCLYLFRKIAKRFRKAPPRFQQECTFSYYNPSLSAPTRIYAMQYGYSVAISQANQHLTSGSEITERATFWLCVKAVVGRKSSFRLKRVTSLWKPRLYPNIFSNRSGYLIDMPAG